MPILPKFEKLFPLNIGLTRDKKTKAEKEETLNQKKKETTQTKIISKKQSNNTYCKYPRGRRRRQRGEHPTEVCRSTSSRRRSLTSTFRSNVARRRESPS